MVDGGNCQAVKANMAMNYRGSDQQSMRNCSPQSIYIHTLSSLYLKPTDNFGLPESLSHQSIQGSVQFTETWRTECCRV